MQIELYNKTDLWNGQNKAFSRYSKTSLITGLQTEGKLPPQPHVLSLAGGQAHFERLLVSRAITIPSKIDTVQACSSSKEQHTLKQLLGTIKTHSLGGMQVWSGTLEKFSQRSSLAAALRTPSFNSRSPYHVLDLDLCGTFSGPVGGAITNLFKHEDFADRGVLFINHLKGREKPQTLLPFLKRYFGTCSHYVPAAGKVCDSISKQNVSTEVWDTIRFQLIPSYYLCQAFKHNYLMQVIYLLEYRDTNKATGKGSTMLQWFFEFRKFQRGRAASHVVSLENNLEKVGNGIKRVIKIGAG